MSRKLTHEEFIIKLERQNKHFGGGEFDIIDKYINCSTKVRCRCFLGHIWAVTPAHLLHDGCGCPFCSGNAAWIGFNDLWTVRPDVAKLLKNPEDGYILRHNSNKKVEFVCPKCNSIILKPVYEVSNQGLSCSMCSDGVSYPNKFGRALLAQLPIEDFECEYSPQWARPYRYDNYFKYQGQSYILEMDGAFHFEEKPYSKLSLEERMIMDDIKTQNAINQGIVIIRIDCRISKLDYIKESILQSHLSQLFDLSSVDWNACDKSSCTSLVKMACDLYMSGINNTATIGKTLCVTRKAVIDYLKRGARVGWCNYSADDAIRKRGFKPILAIDLNSNTVYKFDNAKVCVDALSKLYNIHMRYDCIVRARLNDRPYKGFKFTYVNNTIQNDFKEENTNG
jgi:hypothetical protein